MSIEQSQSIHLLPEHIIDQIKAGEVVEKPANVLKELLENSIDAGAKNIKIIIQNNGLDLINIEDDGDGISFNDLPYAFCRHATSKINSFEDIYQLNTFGFRGEALASISSIARVSCHSIPKGFPESGGKIVVHGAQTIEHTPYRSSEVGTSIFVRDLFYNTPVRLKFVRSRVSEKNALKRIINAFLLTNPCVRFSIQFDDDDKEIYQAIESHDIEKRIQDVFFKNKKNINKEIYCDLKSYLGSQVTCYLSHHSTKGNSGKQQFLFVNNRLFLDKKIHNIVVRSMEALWGFSTSGHYYININVPENELDVNVHPNKILVKFLNENEIFSLVSSTIKEIKNRNMDFSSNDKHELSFENDIDSNNNQTNYSSDNIWQKLNRPQHNESLFNDTSSEQEQYHFGQSRLFEDQSEHGIFHIDAQIFLLQVNHSIKKSYFLNVNPILNFELLSLENNPNVQITPLLISEPFTCKQFQGEDDFFRKMDSIGFECDRLDEETIALRSLPQVFEESPYIQIFTDLLESAKSNSLLQDVNFQSVQLNENIINRYVEKIGIPKLIEIGSLKLISKSNIIKKFYGK